MKDFRQLKVWQKAHQLALKVYAVTKGFPKEEIYGLTAQMRRAAVSVPNNIAEGCGRRGDAELARFCEVAAGSASELEYLLLLAHDLGYLRPSVYEHLSRDAEEVKRMLASLIQRLRDKS